MKKYLLATVALVALGAPALAADLGPRSYTKAPPQVMAPIYNWTGFYIGGHIGGVFTADDSIAGGLTGGNRDGVFMGGAQVGADYQFAPNWVLGVEGQYSWLDNGMSDVALGGGVFFSDRQKGLASVTGRLGYTWGPALLYVKGGWGYTDYSTSLTGIGAGAVAINSDKNGYTVGGGLEYMFTPNWSGKIEYQYFDFGSANFAIGPVAYEVKNDQHTVKAGLNYRFNWGGPAVAARY